MKKFLSVLTCFTLVLAAGCGSKKSETPAGADTPATDAKQDVALTVWVGDNYVGLTEELAKEFIEANADKANITVTVGIESESTAKDTILTDPTAAADVYTFADDQIVALVQGKAIQPVADTTYVTNNSAAGAVDASTVGGTVYAYPMTASNGYFMYYNSEYFTEEDVTSMNKMCEVAAAAGKSVNFEISGWYLYSFFKGAGLDMYINDDQVTNFCNWNDAKGVDVVNGMLDLVATGGLSNLSDANAVAAAKEGTVIAAVNGTWNSGAYQEAFGDGYACTKLPTFTVAGEELQMSSFSGYKLIGVNPYSENVGWAMELAKWLTSEDAQVRRYKDTGDGPANPIAAQNEEVLADKALSALVAQSAYAAPQRVGGNYWAPAETLEQTIMNGNPDGTDIQELLDNAVAGITAAAN